MIKEFLETFRPPSADRLATRELEHGERSLLRALTQLEYAQCMVDFHTSTVNRLKSRNLPPVPRTARIGRAA